ncbi:hypothetical protein ABLE91_15620 [Aquabacter sp. CN5-332]|uniref:hypothetical protein n=1 Tax=Aquabacter sp. CN5-332 TaxID=3156608 RepID=UPI0032B5F55F
MPATGRTKTVLCTFMDIAAEEEPGFKDWYNREHMRDRILGLPGFVRGRRYINVSPGPKYFAFYEAEDKYILQSPDYLKLVTNPDPASRHYITRFKNAIRTVARVSGSLGEAEGTALAVIPFSPSSQEEEGLRSHLLEQAAPFLMQQPGIIACQLLERDETLSASASGQHVRRGDRTLDWALLVEGNDVEDLRDAVSKAGSMLGSVSTAPLAGVTYLRQLYRVSPN